MNWILKNKKKNSKTLLVVLFLAFAMFVFSGSRVAKADSQSSCKGEGATWDADTSKCVCSNLDGQKRVFDSYAGGCAFEDVIKGDRYKNTGVSPAATAHNVDQGKYGMTATCGKDSDMLCTFKMMLIGVFNFCGWLFGIAATLFSWAIDPKNVSGANGMLNKQAVKDVWIMVRDLLNMTFILVLLFAAFCTIFQVDKWNLKKVWLNVLINALLVNFSFPIARLFIDISNVAFYYFVNHLFTSTGDVTGNAIFANFNAFSKLGDLLQPKDYSEFSVAYIIAMIVVVFIMGVTILVIAALFLIRLIALTILIMFSPIGFVGYIFPSTGKYADKWWDNLFSYAFFAPIMIFVMAIALRIMEVLHDENFQSFISNANANSTDPKQASWIASAAFYVIPIMILWIGMGIAKSMSIAGASEITGQAQKFSKWAGNNFSGLRTANWFANKAVPSMAKAGARKFERDVLAKRGLSPRAFLAAWDANTKSSDENKISVATGAWRDRLNKFWSSGKDKTHFRDAAFQANVLKKAKELGDVNQESEFLMSEYQNAKRKKDVKTMSAVLRMMFSNNDQNEFMKLQGLDVDPSLMRETIFDQLHEAGMSKSDAAKQLSDYSEIAVSKGNYANYGMAYMDTTTGQFMKNGDKRMVPKKDSLGNPVLDPTTGLQIEEDHGQVACAAGKASNVKAQSKTDNWHWNSFLVQKADGSSGSLHAVGKAQLAHLKQSEISQLGRARADFIERLGQPAVLAEIRAEAAAVGGSQGALIKSFADNIDGLKNTPGFKVT